jgi:hypothetical protein
MLLLPNATKILIVSILEILSPRTYSGIDRARRTRIIPFKKLYQTIHQIVRITFEKNFVSPVNLIILVPRHF